MSKGLEALERVKKSHYVAMACLGVGQDDTETLEAIDTIEKELKTLEIIKRVFQVAAFFGYKLKDFVTHGWINEEEYNLLLEVLY